MRYLRVLGALMGPTYLSQSPRDNRGNTETGSIALDCRVLLSGLTIKMYTTKESKKITSRFPRRGRVTDSIRTQMSDSFAKNVSRSVFPVINIDSVYVSSDKKLSVQLKWAEGLIDSEDVALLMPILDGRAKSTTVGCFHNSPLAHTVEEK